MQYGAHRNYRNYIHQLSLLSKTHTKQIKALQQHIEYIERYEMGVKGIIHARRVVMPQYMLCAQLMKGEGSNSTKSSSGNRNKGGKIKQGYISSAYDWWYSAPESTPSPSSSTTGTTGTTGNRAFNAMNTAVNNDLVDAISGEALNMANYLNVHCTVNIELFTLTTRNKHDVVLLEANMAGNSIVQVHANGSWSTSSKITRLDVRHQRSNDPKCYPFVSLRNSDHKSSNGSNGSNDNTTTVTGRPSKRNRKKSLIQTSLDMHRQEIEHVLALDFKTTIHGTRTVVDVALELAPMQVVLDMPCVGLVSAMFGRAFTDRQKNQATHAGRMQLESLLETAKEGME